MDPRPPPFAARGPQDLADLIRSQALAWVCSTGADGPIATPLPLLLHADASGRPVAVEGHFGRANPQVAALRTAPVAQLLWLGVHGYVSPSWMADRTQAPTWNYASAQCRVRIRFDDDGEGPDATGAAGTADAPGTAEMEPTETPILRHLRALTDRHEAGRPHAWSIDEMGPRLHHLARRVIGFRAEVLDWRERYKLGQDERDDVYADILTGLAGSGQAALVDWMRRFNPGRGPRSTVIDPGAADAPAPPS